jgi:hypothetical protein
MPFMLRGTHFEAHGSHKKKGYLVPGYNYFPELEKRHYYSRILKFAITIFNFPQICHKIRMKTSRVQLQAYRKMYISFSSQ